MLPFTFGDVDEYLAEIDGELHLYSPILKAEALPLTASADDLAASIDTLPYNISSNFHKFVKQSLKEALVPYSSDFKYVNTVLNNVGEYTFMDYYDTETDKCVTAGIARILTTYENCELDILKMKFDRNKTYVCTAEKCNVKFSFKTTMSDKTTKAWKVGAKLTPSIKAKVEIPFLAGVEVGVGLEISIEYGEAYEKAVTHEKTFETSAYLLKNQIGIPTTAAAGVRCGVSVRMLNHNSGLTMKAELNTTIVDAFRDDARQLNMFITRKRLQQAIKLRTAFNSSLKIHQESHTLIPAFFNEFLFVE